MRAFWTAVLYFGTFLVIGYVARLLIERWMGHRGLDASDKPATGGGDGGGRPRFLLGAWRRDD
ncbi:MAG: hypothetical protein IPK81_23080 [Rhodospirillales bacterium]|nr:MAG: hypothetical protein IPK81_23080 [Rhodospirillales bacterium]